MRDKVIKTIFDYWEGNHPGADWDDAEWNHGKLSDTIISALPSMVKPLEWVEECDFQCSEVFECETPFGKYSAFQAHDRDDWSWVLEDGPLCPEEHGIKSMDEAKAKAAAHRVSLALAAFGIEVET